MYEGRSSPGGSLVDVSPASTGPIVAIVVTYESSVTLERCLRSILASASRRGVRVLVVDNGSTDGTVAIASGLIGPTSVIRLPANRGFGAGVNAGLAAAGTAALVAVVNPDVEIPPDGLDQLADELDRRPGAGIAGPSTVDAGGRRERTVGPFPTPEREWAHSWLLDHLGWPGRFAPSPAVTAEVDWVSGCAWLLRADAVRAVGPLDEAYFMYFEDVDYCRRLHDAGWSVLHVPGVRWTHGLGLGSRLTGAQPADGGPAALRYFRKFHPAVPEARMRALLLRGWRLRLVLRRVRAALGDARSRDVARRYEVAIDRLGRA
jgi:GT2 family glycosyltransferase